MTTLNASTGSGFDRLVASCTGPVLIPEDDAYARACASWNVTWNHHPAVVVQAAGEADVIAAVRFAADQGLAVVVQATGHGVTTTADDRSLLLQTAGLDAIRLDPDARQVTVGGGVTWSPVLAQAQQHGLAPLLGSAPHVGAVGYTLGGGFGWLGRAHGLAVDQVRSLRVVLADGRVVTTSPDHEPDLFWALCGAGGGSLGVVVEMTIGLAEVAEVYAGNLFYPLDAAGDVFERYRTWVAQTPQALTSAFNITAFPPLDVVPAPLRAKTFVIVRGCQVGEPAEAAAQIDRWRQWRTPLIDTWGAMPFARSAEISQDPVDPVPAASSGRWLATLDDQVLDAMLAGFPDDGPPSLLFAETRHAGGAISRPNPHVSFAARDAAHSLEMVGLVTSPEVAAGIDRRFTSTWQQLAGHLAQLPGYLNFVEGPERVDAMTQAFDDEHLRRLAMIKRAYDPTDVFRYGVRLAGTGPYRDRR